MAEGIRKCRRVRKTRTLRHFLAFKAILRYIGLLNGTGTRQLFRLYLPLLGLCPVAEKWRWPDS